MPDKKPESAAIKVTGSKNIHMEGNVSVGFDHLADVSNSENVTAKSNVALQSDKPSADPWYRRPLGIIAVGVFITVVGGLVLAFIKGWISQ
jgi:hypothetical protein